VVEGQCPPISNRKSQALISRSPSSVSSQNFRFSDFASIKIGELRMLRIVHLLNPHRLSFKKRKSCVNIEVASHNRKFAIKFSFAMNHQEQIDILELGSATDECWLRLHHSSNEFDKQFPLKHDRRHFKQ
jgi:hypothetical protein